MTGNDSAHIIGGKHFTRSSCFKRAMVMTRPSEANHEIRPVMWPGDVLPPPRDVMDLQMIVMRLRIAEAAAQLIRRYALDGPHTAG
jgi:hypothetical protein